MKLPTKRKCAIENGEKFYHGGVCNNCLSTLKYTSWGSCVMCAARYAGSKQKKQYDVVYWEKNKEHIVKRQKEYYEKNKNHILLRVKQWSNKNHEKVKAIKSKYKAKRRAQELSGDETKKVAEWLKKQVKKCYYCGVSCKKNYHIDHYEPLSKGGTHEITNLRISCPTCNLTKNAKDPYEFSKIHGKLF